MSTETIPVLVTGGKGMLGTALAQEAASFPQFKVHALGRDELDVRDREAVMAWADRVRGGWIVHCAARVDVEGCAREPDVAREIIVEGTRNVARLAAHTGVRLAFPQSFLIYDGAHNPIAEQEEPRPLSLYGALKWEAEQVVLDFVPDALVVRMAGFFGGEAADKNFVGRIVPAMRAAIDRGERSFSVGDRVWQPTWTRDLAFNTLHLLACNATGSYQMACHGEASFAEIAEVIVDGLGWTGRLTIEHVSASAVSGSELGRRPDRAVLSATRLQAEDLDLQRDWRSTLRAYLAHPFFDRYRLEPAQ